MTGPRFWALLASGFLLASSARAAEFHAAPNGSPSGDGSPQNPWDLATALAGPSSVAPGDTIWLEDGTYAGTFTSSLSGTAAAPIVVRQAPGAHATIDGGASGGSAILTVGGAYTWYWGFEIESSDPGRVSAETGSAPSDIQRGTGIITAQVDGAAAGVKFINLVIHDAAQGFGFWKEATDAEIYGCLIYYNGWDAPDRGHGHGIYTQNDSGTKTLADNIIFDQFSYGIHAYGSDNAFLKNFQIEGNVIFDNGVLAQINPGFTSSILLGGESGPNGNSIVSGGLLKDNVTYSSDGSGLTGSVNVGYSAGCSSDVSIDGNTFAQGTALRLVSCSVATVTNNTLIGSLDGFQQSDYPNNSFFASPPSTNQVVVRPNQYEPGRANIAVMNWENAASVSVDLGPANLATGSSYEIRDAENYFGTPVASGTYDGSAVAIPMQGLVNADPIGTTKPPHSAPGFGAFVLLGTPGTGGTAGSGGSATGGSGNAGSGATSSGGAATGGANGSGGAKSSGGDDSGGCGCRVASRSSGSALGVALGLALLALRRRSRVAKGSTRR